jgi:hypothetical protein
MQPPDTRAPGEEVTTYGIQLEPPGPDRLFRLESEASLMQRMRQERREQPGTPASASRDVFPEEPVLSREIYLGRRWPPLKRDVEPHYVCYNRLYFEQPNFERSGWDLGAVTPFVSAGKFFLDVATLPYHAGTDPCRHFDCSSGWCLPGDPVPLLLFPPPQSLTGYLAEGAAIGGGAAIFP